jgi:hypothetical protein
MNGKYKKIIEIWRERCDPRNGVLLILYTTHIPVFTQMNFFLLILNWYLLPTEYVEEKVQKKKKTGKTIWNKALLPIFDRSQTWRRLSVPLKKRKNIIWVTKKQSVKYASCTGTGNLQGSGNDYFTQSFRFPKLHDGKKLQLSYWLVPK